MNHIYEYFRLMGLFLIIMIPITLVSVILLPIVDWIKPMQGAVEALEQEYPDQVRVLVGYSSESKLIGGTKYYSKNNSYILIPSVFMNPSTYTYSIGNDRKPVLFVNKYGAIITLVFWVVIAALCKYIAFPKIKNRLQTPWWQKS